MLCNIIHESILMVHILNLFGDGIQVVELFRNNKKYLHSIMHHTTSLKLVKRDTMIRGVDVLLG